MTMPRPLSPFRLAMPLAVLAALPACKRPKAGPPPPTSSAEPTPEAPASAGSSAPTASVAASGSAATPAALPDRARYAWLGSTGRESPPAVTTLAAAIPTPPGWERIPAPPGSFAAWLRELPLAAPGTPVKDWRGDEVYGGDDEYVKAVIAIDVGRSNLQQSADVVVRLHAEWQWSLGRRDQEYVSATKDPLPYARYAEGKRTLAQGPHLYWVKQRDPNDVNDYDAFRDFLDAAFLWINSPALRMQSEPVAADALMPGDFFVRRDKSGHTVVVLDVVTRANGERLALLGQGIAPAMNPHVLRPGRGTAWFSLRPPEPLLTPYTKEFAWEELRRLPVDVTEPAP